MSARSQGAQTSAVDAPRSTAGQILRPAVADEARPGGDATPPDIVITVYGQPAPQGSKRHVGNGVMVEMSKRLKPWRQDVKEAALNAMLGGYFGSVAGRRPPLDGPLAASVVFTVRDQPAGKPTWWPGTQRWSKSLRWRPASTPDLSKLLRSTEDALTGVCWKDDARVVEYRRLAKYYAGHPAPDVLDRPGAVIRIWALGGAE